MKVGEMYDFFLPFAKFEEEFSKTSDQIEVLALVTSYFHVL